MSSYWLGELYKRILKPCKCCLSCSHEHLISVEFRKTVQTVTTKQNIKLGSIYPHMNCHFPTTFQTKRNNEIR